MNMLKVLFATTGCAIVTVGTCLAVTVPSDIDLKEICMKTIKIRRHYKDPLFRSKVWLETNTKEIDNKMFYTKAEVDRKIYVTCTPNEDLIDDGVVMSNYIDPSDHMYLSTWNQATSATHANIDFTIKGRWRVIESEDSPVFFSMYDLRKNQIECNITERDYGFLNNWYSEEELDRPLGKVCALVYKTSWKSLQNRVKSDL